ncbi:ovomucoid-like isoform X2 [Varanus komodoensis]|uniref:ovomucoid-like isoform X1 n=1 Tax=Varanus komodoensis TaxID=61221 RepID=UPI001CF7C943|nr:ovomucoid-like isoform X1 [Varanus komodoensis]XP_044306949.1 ovomucoid-like isoform X2 [Varanus komodoensis]
MERNRNIGKKHNGECEEMIPTQEFYCRQFSPETHDCTQDNDLHCGSDGKTYKNKCEFCTADPNGSVLLLEHLREC